VHIAIITDSDTPSHIGKNRTAWPQHCDRQSRWNPHRSYRRPNDEKAESCNSTGATASA